LRSGDEWGRAFCETKTMGNEQLTIEQPRSNEELKEFSSFADDVYAERAAHWPAIAELELPLLKGEGPGAEGRTALPLVARYDGQIVARGAAVVDRRYIEHWDEPLGHLIMFEALPDTTDAVRALADEACGWLKGFGLEAVRTGMGPSYDMPYLLDAYELLPPISTRQNPAYYHSLLKEARFETEKGLLDYKIRVTPQLTERWEHMLRSAQKAGFQVLTFSEVEEKRRIPDFYKVWNEAFAGHWGMSPGTEAEWQELFAFMGPLGAYDISVLAYRDDEPMGAILCIPDMSAMATLVGGRELLPEERLNLLGIGVLEGARGTGLNLAIAARSYLELVERGSSYVSYTIVLDDNWPSRRTAEKLGARVCANYLVYRRAIGRPS
jgi:hypothetical protein